MVDKSLAGDTFIGADNAIYISRSDAERGRTKSTPKPLHAWYDPRGWTPRRRLTGAIALIIAAIIMAVIASAIEGAKRRKTPTAAYLPLHYELVDTYAPADFLSRFDYFSDDDPTDGFVQYVDRETATALNLTYATATSVVLRVDTSSSDSVDGRHSVRLESKARYDSGLFLFDILHTPYGCGTWPALWLTDPYNWPENGEIDILESTNRGNKGNTVTLHTGKECWMEEKEEGRDARGTLQWVSCDNRDGDAGCSAQSSPETYGPEMNEAGGGVYALELREAGIRAWYFSRKLIPDDISSADSSIIPDPSTWPSPLADFSSRRCDIAAQFKNQSIIVNIDLCGQLGAQPELYKELFDCPATCDDFVAHSPGNFTEAYWEFRVFKVYQADFSFEQENE